MTDVFNSHVAQRFVVGSVVVGVSLAVQHTASCGSGCRSHGQALVEEVSVVAEVHVVGQQALTRAV